MWKMSIKQLLLGCGLGISMAALAACGTAQPISQLAPELFPPAGAMQGAANGAAEDNAMTANQETQVKPVKVDKSQFKVAREISSNTWLNSPKLDWQSLRGKVVVVDFWTFACYN